MEETKGRKILIDVAKSSDLAMIDWVLQSFFKVPFFLFLA